MSNNPLKDFHKWLNKGKTLTIVMSLLLIFLSLPYLPLANTFGGGLLNFELLGGISLGMVASFMVVYLIIFLMIGRLRVQ